MYALSPGTMRSLRKIADQNGSTIEEVMATAMEEFEMRAQSREGTGNEDYQISEKLNARLQSRASQKIMAVSI